MKPKPDTAPFIAETHRSGLANFLRNHPHKGGIIVHPERQFIYMKAAKTAGTSLFRSVLEPMIGGFTHQKADPDRFAKIMSGLTDEKLEKFFIFAVVRDPLDRFISMSTYLDGDIESFLKDFDKHNEDENTFYHTRPLALYTHLDGRPFVDAICQAETLQEHMNAVFDYLDLPRWSIPRKNRTKTRNRHTKLNPYQAAEVKELYAQDMALYGYDGNAFVDRQERRKTKWSN